MYFKEAGKWYYKKAILHPKTCHSLFKIRYKVDLYLSLNNVYYIIILCN